MYVNINDDSAGSTRYYISTPVVVQPNSILIDTLIKTLLSSNSSNMIASMTSSGVQAATSLISSFVLTLNAQTTTGVTNQIKFFPGI